SGTSCALCPRSPWKRACAISKRQPRCSEQARVPGSRTSGTAANLQSMTSANDQQAQFGPHRFYAGEGGGSEQFRGARFDVADMRGARFTDCDLTGVTIRDGWLVDVNISGYLSNVTINGVDVADFVSTELDRRHPERVQLREIKSADG